MGQPGTLGTTFIHAIYLTRDREPQWEQHGNKAIIPLSDSAIAAADLSQIGSGGPVVNYERGLPLRSEPEGLFDVVDLSDDVALRQPADLSFSDHVHGFIPRNGSQCPID